jgi:hypothetical protein
MLKRKTNIKKLKKKSNYKIHRLNTKKNIKISGGTKNNTTNNNTKSVKLNVQNNNSNGTENNNSNGTENKNQNPDELTDKEMISFVAYLASDDRSFITKCYNHVNNDSDDDEVKEVKKTLKKLFPAQKDCEIFALNILGKVSLFKNLFDYYQMMPNQGKQTKSDPLTLDDSQMMTNQGKQTKSDPLTLDRIDKISKSMEVRCNDSDEIKSSLVSNPLSSEDKELVSNIFKKIYSVKGINSILGKMLSEQKQITDKLVLSKSQTNDPSVANEIKDLKEFSNLINEIHSDSGMVANISINIKKMIDSYFGLEDNEDCENSVSIMGLLKALKALLTVPNSKQLTQEVKNKMIGLILESIMQIDLNDKSKVPSSQSSQSSQSGGVKESRYKKFKNFLTNINDNFIKETFVYQAYTKLTDKTSNPAYIVLKILGCIPFLGGALSVDLLWKGAKGLFYSLPYKLLKLHRNYTKEKKEEKLRKAVNKVTKYI